MTPLAQQLVSRMAALTAKRSLAQALANVEQNLPHVQGTIADLAARVSDSRSPSAIVIGAGPSLHRRNPVAEIRESGYEGDIVAADGALGYCLRNGLVPDYIVSLDPHPARVCRWFGDPELGSRQDGDDYFRRQDLDPYLGIDEVQRNRALIELVNRQGSSITAVICTSVAPNVRRRCEESGMMCYWWNPLMDDLDQPESVTRQLYRRTRIPCMVSGGNVGAAAWVVASQVLKKREVALVGMDFSYAPGTPMGKTQYFKELTELFGDRAQEALIPVKNPYLKETWVTDPAYHWYRDSFLEMAAQTATQTYNCTEGGILFGDPIQWSSVKDFLEAHCSIGAAGSHG